MKSKHLGLGVPGACSKKQTLGPGDVIDVCGVGDVPALFLILFLYTHKYPHTPAHTHKYTHTPAHTHTHIHAHRHTFPKEVEGCLYIKADFR